MWYQIRAPRRPLQLSASRSILPAGSGDPFPGGVPGCSEHRADQERQRTQRSRRPARERRSRRKQRSCLGAAPRRVLRHVTEVCHGDTAFHPSVNSTWTGALPFPVPVPNRAGRDPFPNELFPWDPVSGWRWNAWSCGARALATGKSRGGLGPAGSHSCDTETTAVTSPVGGRLEPIRNGPSFLQWVQPPTGGAAVWCGRVGGSGH